MSGQSPVLHSWQGRRKFCIISVGAVGTGHGCGKRGMEGIPRVRMLARLVYLILQEITAANEDML